MRTCLVATCLADHLGVPDHQRSSIYFAGLLRHLGCTAFAHEAAELAGDDHDLIRTFEAVDTANKRKVLGRAIGSLAKGAGAGKRTKAIAKVLTTPSAGRRLAAAQCDQASALARDLGFGDGVQAALSQMYERHDGKGDPHRLKGDAISLEARVVHAAQVIEALHRRSGRAATLDEIHARRGAQLAPDVSDAAIAAGDALWTALETETPHEDVLAVRRISPPRTSLAEVALAFGRFADLKTPHAVGHSPAVSALAADAGRHAGLDDEEIEKLRLAGLLHDLGSVSVGNQIWDRAGPLGVTGWEQVRLHAYHTERILALSSVTRPLAALAGSHHERLDASGYPRGTRELSRAERILAAADEYAALVEDRPYRAALTPADAAKVLVDDASAGKLCRDAVTSVLAAAGQPLAPTKRALPAGLTEREAEVLGLVARGLASKEIAVCLDIATRTVKHHIEHVYAKTGVSTRAAAALYAARHDLVAPAAGPRPNDP